MPVVGGVARTMYRTNVAARYLTDPLQQLVKWVFTSRETTNFTYDLELRNKQHLAALLSNVLDVEFHDIIGYFDEIENDTTFRRHVSDTTRESEWRLIADERAQIGRRIGWYAIARVLRPRVIVETGVDKGLGACVLSAALMRNTEEGHDGRYFGTDIRPDAGYLLCGDYARFGSVLYGDSIQSLRTIDGPIDLFVNDSDHSATYEAEEYAVIAEKLSDDAIVLGDNAHCTDKLLEFSLGSGRQFVFFQEKPRSHWYPGAGIGISFRRQAH